MNQPRNPIGQNPVQGPQAQGPQAQGPQAQGPQAQGPQAQGPQGEPTNPVIEAFRTLALFIQSAKEANNPMAQEMEDAMRELVNVIGGKGEQEEQEKPMETPPPPAAKTGSKSRAGNMMNGNEDMMMSNQIPLM